MVTGVGAGRIGGRRRETMVVLAIMAVVALSLTVLTAAVSRGRTPAVANDPASDQGSGTAAGTSGERLDLGQLRGITVSGADFGAGDNIGTGTGDRFSNLAPGRRWNNDEGGTYRYPDPASLRFLADRGVEVVRLTFRWERIQPDLAGDLDVDEVALLNATIDAADEAGLQVIPALMNYGAYWLDEGGVGVRQPIGSPEVAVDTFARTWRLLAEALSHHDNIAAYGLMNEPVDVAGGSAGWELASSEAAKAIRSTGSSTVIAVPTYQWSNVHRVLDEHPDGPWVDDSLDPIIYEVHQYFSTQRSGEYQSYAAELQVALSEGWTESDDADALTRRSIAELEQFVVWLDDSPGWVGEVGWPNDHDVEEWNQLADKWFSEANSAGLWVTVWTTGSFWRNDYHLLAYRSSTGASGVLDAPTPSAAVLENNL